MPNSGFCWELELPERAKANKTPPVKAIEIPIIPITPIFSLKNMYPKIARNIGTVSTSVVDIATSTCLSDKNQVAKWIARNSPAKTHQWILFRVDFSFNQVIFFLYNDRNNAPIPANKVLYMAITSEGTFNPSNSSFWRYTTIIAAKDTAIIATNNYK